MDCALVMEGPRAQHLVPRHAQGGVAFSLLFLRRPRVSLGQLLARWWRRPASLVRVQQTFPATSQ